MSIININRRAAAQEDKPRVLSAIRFCRKHGLNFLGYPFMDESFESSGVQIELIVPTGTSSADMRVAIRHAYIERDVVAHSVIICPGGWFREALS